MNLAKRTNWGHNFYVSYWRRDRHFMELSEPREGLAVWRTKEVPSFLRPKDPEYWSGPLESNPRPLAAQSSALPTEVPRFYLSVSHGRPHKASIFTCKCSANKRLFSTWQFLRFFSLSSKTLDKNVYTSRTSVEEGSNSSACRHTKKQKNTPKVSHLRSKLQGYCCLKSTLC